MSAETDRGTVERAERGRGPQVPVLSWLLAPVAPLLAVVLAYRIYHPPRRGHHRMPSEFGLDVTDVRLPQPASGPDLHCWLVEGEDDKVVVLGHGVGLSKSASLAHARMLHDAGWTVVMFDHRNHGLSGSDRRFTCMSERFTDDVETVVRHVRRQPRWTGATVVVYGFSFSTFPLVHALGRDDFHVDAVIGDSGPAAAVTPLFTAFLRAGGLPLAGPFRSGPAAWLVDRVFVAAGTAMLKPTWPPPVTGRFAVTPMLFVVGEDDQIVDADGVERLAELFPGADVVRLPGVAHLNGMKVARDVYTDSVVAFLTRTAGTPA